MSSVCRTSHLALVGLPVTVMYEEANSFRHQTQSNFSMMASVAVEQLSVREVMHNDPVTGNVTDTVQLVKFNREAKDATKTDFHFVYKDLLPNGDGGDLDKSSMEIRDGIHQIALKKVTLKLKL